ncbi:MAG TPA: hypothetical protein VMU27_01600 [Candidatus Paceibacterota bacterium]|nr:hypothetical protein [Candidatus Paceibacterota bacterium]
MVLRYVAAFSAVMLFGSVTAALPQVTPEEKSSVICKTSEIVIAFAASESGWDDLPRKDALARINQKNRVCSEVPRVPNGIYKNAGSPREFTIELDDESYRDCRMTPVTLSDPKIIGTQTGYLLGACNWVRLTWWRKDVARFSQRALSYFICRIKSVIEMYPILETILAQQNHHVWDGSGMFEYARKEKGLSIRSGLELQQGARKDVPLLVLLP